MTRIVPQELYPLGGEQPTFRLLDVRAPVEFARGAMPFSVNLPILSDEERRLVGIRYKEAGPEAAIKLGYALTEAVMPERVAAWRALCAEGPTAVSCWRGGLRSELAAGFIGLPGVVRVEGGYKALRAYVMARLEERIPTLSTLVIAGFTGSGKTALLHEIGRTRDDVLALDLEAEAGHRGSAFGSLGPQPSQASFENSLATKLTLSRKRFLMLEDESRNIGKRQLPDPLYRAIQGSPVVLVEEPLTSRLRRIHRDYVLSEATGVETAGAFLAARLQKLKKRLGGEVLERSLKALEEATKAGAWRDPEAHYDWIAPLLEAYYDPLYRRSLGKMDRPVLFRGTREECSVWLNRQSG